MCVRLKLDQCGIKLTLKQWNRIPGAERRQLVSAPCQTPATTESYKALLVRLIESCTSSKPEHTPLDSAPAWADSSATPQRLITYSAAMGVAPPSGAQWASLTPLQRFALFKLTRPGHDNDNFIPAMREFGILQ